jgi:hypothetical protein
MNEMRNMKEPNYSRLREVLRDPRLYGDPLMKKLCEGADTIRGDFCIDVGRNVIHGSDSVESANHEINLWFKPEELVTWTNHSDCWVYE